MPKSRKRAKAVLKAKQQRQVPQQLSGGYGLGRTIPREAQIRSKRADLLEAKLRKLSAVLPEPDGSLPAGVDPIFAHVVELLRRGAADVEADAKVPAGLSEMLWDWIEAPATETDDIQESLAAQPSLTAAVTAYLRKVVENKKACNDAVLARLAELEASGRRIVGGGSTGPETWEITDWRTGQILAEGRGGYRGYDEATDRLDPDHLMSHIDRVTGPIYERFDDALPQIPGIPESLAETLRDWVENLTTATSDIAAITGLDHAALHAIRRESELGAHLVVAS